MTYVQEIDALQRWVHQDAGLNSMKLSGAPPTVARPVILWEHPRRGRQRNYTRYKYGVRVRQSGKLYVASYDQAASLMDNLLSGIEERYGVLHVYERVGSKKQVAMLKGVNVEFGEAEGMNIPFTVTYDATYTRYKPQDAPAPRVVYQRVEVEFE